MLVHRFREQLRSILPATAEAAPFGAAFVPCPVATLLAPSQVALAQEVYRRAAELTREQLRETPRLPAFSMN